MKRITVTAFDELAAEHRQSDEALAKLVAATRPKVERAMARAMVRDARLVMARSFSDLGDDSEGQR